MITFYAVAFATLVAGMGGYLLGASKEWELHRATIKTHNELTAYSNQVTGELKTLRAANVISPWGPMNPSSNRRPHLKSVN